ncbi:MAG: DUF4215 domain-containing protein, partial [Rhodobacterales bacterium]|nr:DUF4215 domain-containing protein [Rhodobacterales bacterium]
GAEECDDSNILPGDGCDDTCQGEPINLLIDCDPSVCTWTVGTGAGGGDECTCVIEGIRHPDANLVEASCFTGSPSAELIWGIDLTGYNAYAATTCNGLSADSSLASFDDHPLAGGLELQCSEDAVGENASYCSKIADPGAGGAPPTLVAAPASNNVVLVVDEWLPGDYWDGVTARTISAEFFFAITTCGNGIPELGEDCDDGNLANNDGCDEFCTFEPVVCGNGYLEGGESCDDGNLIPGDGCSDVCIREVDLATCATVGPRITPTSGTLSCPLNAFLWDVYEITVAPGDCVDIHTNNNVLGAADLLALAVDPSGSGYGLSPAFDQLEDDWACGTPGWNGFGCPSSQVVADTAGTMTVTVGQWGDGGLGGCTVGAGYDLFISVNGTEVMPNQVGDDTTY